MTNPSELPPSESRVTQSGYGKPLKHPFGTTYRRATIPLDSRWLPLNQDQVQTEIDLMRRIKLIVRGAQWNDRWADGPFLLEPDKPTGGKWQLDGTNDWWSHIDYEAKTLVLSARYESQPLVELATWVAAVVGPKE